MMMTETSPQALGLALALLLPAVWGVAQAEPAAPQVDAAEQSSLGTLEEELQATEALLAAGDMLAAYQRAVAVADAHPTSGEALLLLGQAAYYVRREVEAVVALEKSETLSPRNAEIQFYLAILALEAGNAEGGAERLRKATRLEPRNTRYWLQLGVQLLQMGELKDAGKALTKTLKVDPEGPMAVSAHYFLGNVQSQRGRHAEAVAAWEEALALEPDHELALYRLAKHHASKGDPHKALDYSQREAKLRPEDVFVLARLIQAHYRLAQYDEAAAVRAELLEAYATSQDPDISDEEDFCFDWFDVGADRVYAHETFDKSGSLVYWYTFYVVGEDGQMKKTIQLEQSPAIAWGGPAFVLGQTEGRRHQTFPIGFKELPGYPSLKRIVLEILEGEHKAASSSGP